MSSQNSQIQGSFVDIRFFQLRLYVNISTLFFLDALGRLFCWIKHIFLKLRNNLFESKKSFYLILFVVAKKEDVDHDENKSPLTNKLNLKSDVIKEKRKIAWFIFKNFKDIELRKDQLFKHENNFHK
ncbi:hypothetical protein BpHYR1_010602 [Brachionus plicatilis]|uniref:Transmembrane protein n=1 Tax=Brachionus plicatilis TaxID=10195 RepID=A0A3M7S726_BRAPC|nr:hypothetical protein BpHYR1_010602 [Brachionus plicatilis]